MNNDAAHYRKVSEQVNGERIRKAVNAALEKAERHIEGSAMAGKYSANLTCDDLAIVGPVTEALKAKGFNVHVEEHENPYKDDFSTTITVSW